MFYVSLLSWCNVNAQETASVIVHGKSVQLQPSAAVFQTGYGNVTNYFSTYNGPTASLLINSGSNVISGELRPRSGSTDIFEGGYAQYTPVAAIDYGSYTVSIPTTDNDGNGIPDVIQYDKLGNYSATGSGNSAIVGPFSITFQFTRAAGSAVGTYIANTVNSLGGTNTINGVYNLVSYSGTVSYTRGVSNTLSFNITNLASPNLSITGSTTFTTINSNQISYAAFTLSNNSGGVYHANAGTFNRSGNLYSGPLILSDGLLTTSWADFTSYIVQITDTNDSNSNGIPDFSDSVPPTINTQPVSQNTYMGSSVTFSVSAIANAPLSYQWQFNGSNISGANIASYTINNVQQANAGSYTVVISNSLGSITSNAALLNVSTPLVPIITTQPQSISAYATTYVSFSVMATSPVPVTYQWYFNGNAISGATTSSLILSNTSAAQAGLYSVQITNTGGQTLSNAATLTVIPVPVITSASKATGYLGGIPFYYAITTASSASSYSIVQGSLPPGLSLNTATGIISGVPTSSGDYVVTLGASLFTAITKTSALTISINSQPLSYQKITSSLVSPHGIVSDSNGNMWVVDTGNNTIDKITPSGVLTIMAGSAGKSGYVDGLGSVALFNAPTSIAIDSAGNLYVTDSKNSVIRKITSSGVVTTFAVSANLINPYAITIDNQNNIYVTDTSSGGFAEIKKITANGAVSILNTHVINTTTSLFWYGIITSIACDSAGNLYIWMADYGSIKKIDTNLNVSNVGDAMMFTNGTSVINPPSGMVLDSNGNIYFVKTTSGSTTATLVSLSQSGITSVLYSWFNSALFGSFPAICATSAGNFAVTSATGVITVKSASGPAITSQTTSAYLGQTLSVAATSFPEATYQWYLNGVALTTDPTSSSYNPQISGTYAVAVSNNFGTIYSSPIVVTNPPQPIITAQPQNQVAYVGSTVTFTSTAINVSSYQWQFNGVAISGATNPTLTLANLNSSQAGVYSVVAFGSGTPAQSSNATLTVQPALTVPVFYSGLPNLIFIGSNSSTTTYSVTGLPTGLTYDPVSGYISGTLQSTGTYNFTVSVNNGNVTNTLPVSLIVSTPPLAFNSGPDIAANGLAIDSSNNYYYTSGNTIQKLVNGTGAPIIIAGSNTAGGLDGTGTAAMFNSPTGIAVDTSGNLYVADTNNSTIRKITPLGVVTTIAGLAGLTGIANGLGLNARFSNPQGIAVDSSANIYVADTGNNSIRKITSSGVVSTIVSSNTNITAPINLTLDKNLNIYVVNSWSSNLSYNSTSKGGNYIAVVKIDVLGSISVLATNLFSEYTYHVSVHGGGYDNYVDQPLLSSITVDGSGNAYVILGITSKQVYASGIAAFGTFSPINNPPVGLIKISPSGQQSVVTLSGSFDPQVAISTDPFGNIVIAGVLWNSSSPTALQIASIPTTPVIMTQPQNVIYKPSGKTSDQGVYLNVDATAGFQNISYGFNLIGNNLDISIFSGVTYNLFSAGTYIFKIATLYSAILSNPATITVTPSITTQPLSQSASAGSTITLSTSATGGGLSYQWYLNAQPITGATSSSYTINSLAPANSGAYYVVATNAAGSVTSSAAIVGLPNPGRIANLSVLSMDGPGSQLLTVGFVTGGAGTSGTQQLLIRGTGPALTAFNVANVLPDPTISVYNSSTVVMASNDNWGTPSSNIAIINAADSATGAFALNPTTSNDAALVTNLTTGGYTVQVAGKNSASGNALAEVYDDTPAGTYNVGVPRLINISCLEQFSAGGYLTAGFIIGGTTSETVLIRASGPTIGAAPFNVTGAISDPKLTVYDSNTNVIATNAGWAGNALISAAATKVGAFPFGSSSKDSAVLMTLNPGQYTVQAASTSGTAGVTLIEVYEVPAN